MRQFPRIRTGFGKIRHRFLPPDSSKLCVIGGIIFDEISGFQGNSDGDVVFHALCNAISSLTGIQIFDIAEELYNKEGIIDSEVYLKEAIKLLGKQKISHVAIVLEAKRPYFKDVLEKMRSNIARILQIDVAAVGVTVISGDGLSDAACGDGVQCEAIITTEEP